LFVNALKKALSDGTERPENVTKNMQSMLEQLLKPCGGASMRCLVPMAIDQSPYFMMARQTAHVLECPKPSTIHSEFLPGLTQDNEKMSSTSGETLFLDSSPEEISKCIKKYAFSGGRTTKEEHQKYGGNVSIDIAYQYLTFFMESDSELEEIARKYTQGELLSGQLKTITADLISSVVKQHQQRKLQITPELVSEFFNYERVFDIGGCYGRESLSDDVKTDFSRGAGLDFDRTYGLKPKSEQ
jgi:tryptophanyl-tRNA synthetase